MNPTLIPRRGVQRLNREEMTAEAALLAMVQPSNALTENRARRDLASASIRVGQVNDRFGSVLTERCGITDFAAPQLQLPSFAKGFNRDATDAAFRQWANRLIDQFDPQRVGRVVWHGRDRCTMSFVDSKVKNGILNKETKYDGHVHELIRARVHPATNPEIELPSRAAAILDVFGEELLPHVAILTGTLVGEGVRPLDVVRERSALGRQVDQTAAAIQQGLRSAARMARASAPAIAIGAGAFGIVAAAGYALSSLAATAAVIAADPGILIGDRVLYAWKD